MLPSFGLFRSNSCLVMRSIKTLDLLLIVSYNIIILYSNF